MKTISDYTIYCTEEQTKKALELSAPLNYCDHSGNFQHEVKIVSTFYVEIPTAEQMIGWLEERGFFIDITNCYDVIQNYTISSVVFNTHGYTDKKTPYPSRKEATLSAIDSALEYLSNNKK